MSSRTRSRKQASIGSNHSLRRPTPISASEPRTGNFVLLLVMAWSPPAHNAGNVRVSAPGDYATFNSNHTPDGTSAGHAQRFLSAHDQINNLFHLRRDHVTAAEHRASRTQTFQVWAEICSMGCQ